MKERQNRYLRKSIAIFCMVGLVFLLGSLIKAQAQARGGQRLIPEKRDAAWTWQAKCVAKELNLSDEDTGKLVTAYKTARKSQATAMQKLRDEAGDDRRAMFENMQELNASERGKFKIALKEFLKEEQTSTVIASLGAFNAQWDTMVDTLLGFNLGDEKLYQALELVNAYMVEVTKIRGGARARSDFQSMRDKLQEYKGKLDTSLALILSEGQLKQWKEATTFQRRRRRNG